MPETTSMLFFLVVVVALIFASVIAIIFSRLNGLEDMIDFYRNEYASTKRGLYALESEIYKLRQERSGMWFSTSQTVTAKAPKEEAEPVEDEVEKQENNE